jgi:hypothetical protein
LAFAELANGSIAIAEGFGNIIGFIYNYRKYLMEMIYLYQLQNSFNFEIRLPLSYINSEEKAIGYLL